MSISPHVNVIHCSQCQRDTAYYCRTFYLNLCPPCKRTHTISIDTKNHDVILYRETFNFSYKYEWCATHPDQVYDRYCETCDLSVCPHCSDHRQHRLQNIKTVYEEKRIQNEDILRNIRSEILYNAQCVRSGLKDMVNTNITTCKKEIFPHLSNVILKKSTKLIDSMNSVLGDNSYMKLLHPCFQQLEISKNTSTGC